ncbi:MAG: YajQ family cyclic di-GMP-binding protein [Candidatus Aquicultor secundus]|uniref:Nucleotide-binding protein COY37_06885 n=1 Tax=Candidatus Aquicultor secundus TaxID=1973895 RepID=A0A2M7T7A4_9ACTN|nr:YajQ family cyclic di-GMP-binding protein [Candidatus Aquicultor secundus]NCO65647.1 YajQ family cyclic di-GMP-binding protein [Solirubrobacter sp.]OIO88935.1 MAG: YajQ family cyclic di-GMP-binding protein [Candidatus Aquicultor secundus]PIU26452.1 MAG: YajQ family cyclic di-GMP-binding protein [Candidatus Aquicultor secundus]PIW21177.1 MAG: YajQ family cyclic di-GMP-binding protein [Candidatus Aquicultor secundus]PIX52978.1 MAG: YajQ family cyclic di-GMP-binding protein [Candidatus Aquicul
MAKDSSFDIVSEVNLQEIDNAVNQANKEISTRYDFKNSKSKISWDKNENEIVLDADDEYKLRSVQDVLHTKLVRRGIDLKTLQYKKPEPASGGAVRQTATIQQGVDADKAREINKFIKNSKLKVQVAIEGTKLRVSAKSKDGLQAVIQLVKDHDFGLPLQFTNYR